MTRNATEAFPESRRTETVSRKLHHPLAERCSASWGESAVATESRRHTAGYSPTRHEQRDVRAKAARELATGPEGRGRNPAPRYRPAPLLPRPRPGCGARGRSCSARGRYRRPGKTAGNLLGGRTAESRYQLRLVRGLLERVLSPRPSSAHRRPRCLALFLAPAAIPAHAERLFDLGRDRSRDLSQLPDGAAKAVA